MYGDVGVNCVDRTASLFFLCVCVCVSASKCVSGVDRLIFFSF